jgi:hypothetical protein
MPLVRFDHLNLYLVAFNEMKRSADPTDRTTDSLGERLSIF